ncbi:hypothetical protein BAE44_0023144, partial [Dichanthelium oligosanthes]
MSPPELIADAVAEILLRVPPEEPAHILRASLVCKPWRRVLHDPAFLRRYREFHGTPPLLGFINNSSESGGHCVPRLVPTTEAASPFPPPDRGSWALDCRHGRVLLHTGAEAKDLLVWDPATGARRGLRKPGPHFWGFSAAVLCAAANCNHLDCHAGPFRVVFVGTTVDQDATWASVYSSETGAWSAAAASVANHGRRSSVEPKRGALVGDGIFFTLTTCSIVRYDLGEHRLSLIDWPDMPEVYGTGGVLMPMEDGSLGLASMRFSSVCLWSRNVDQEGVAGWVKCRVIGLETMLPNGKPFRRADVIGFAEGVGVIFVSTDVGVFTIDLKSESMRKVCEPVKCYSIIPFMSFYTP